MEFRESETEELKQIVVEDVKKEIVAFANSEGGILYIGAADDGSVVGLENPDETIQQLTNMVRDSIKPDVTMFIRYDTMETEGKQLVAVRVQRGTGRPYYLARKGLRPEGVYVRKGTSSVPATHTNIRRMIKETDGDSFEEMRTLEQELTFKAARAEFAGRKLEFGPMQMKTLGILNTDGIYTNLGLLLSDQCAYTIKAATFEGSDQNVFKDRREFSGSLLAQMGAVYEYIDLRNQTHAIFDKLRRIDTRDYPEVAVREALLNSLVHRDYSFRASTMISVYIDRIEFVSIGGLMTGVTLDDVMLGLSVCRNAKLADVFYRLQLIEAYGTGMRKIMGAYQGTGKIPQIETTDNAFKIVLPNLNADAAPNPNLQNTSKDKNTEQIIQLIKAQGAVTRQDVETLLNVSQTTTGRYLKQMLQNGLLLREGKGKNTKYILPH
ncbi:DUF977 family protein [Faecalicatena contorta]|uniref:DUF977 family protein n=1 Tax=Faecalicatena contorta TaxID=39482 RepID=UPI001898DBEA|nr:DUF977 family protein [Faecalicatena contorta]